MKKSQLIKEYTEFLNEAEQFRRLLLASVNAVLEINSNFQEIRAYRKNLIGRTTKLATSLKKLSRKPRFSDPFHGVLISAYDNAFSSDILQRTGRSLDAVIDDLTQIIARLTSMSAEEYARMFPTRANAGGKSQQVQPFDFWQLVHPEIKRVSESRYLSNHFADAVEAAYKEINSVVKKIHKNKTNAELDGSSLMKSAFSIQSPSIIIDDLLTDTGKSMQVGYMEIFSGSMTGIRNPKAHANLVITNVEAQRFLVMASLLMYRIDQARLA